MIVDCIVDGFVVRNDINILPTTQKKNKIRSSLFGSAVFGDLFSLAQQSSW